jgi:NMD protein affecting ribosome stability and mRNA decay
MCQRCDSYDVDAVIENGTEVCSHCLHNITGGNLYDRNYEKAELEERRLLEKEYLESENENE